MPLTQKKPNKNWTEYAESYYTVRARIFRRETVTDAHYGGKTVVYKLINFDNFLNTIHTYYPWLFIFTSIDNLPYKIRSKSVCIFLKQNLFSLFWSNTQSSHSPLKRFLSCFYQMKTNNCFYFFERIRLTSLALQESHTLPVITRPIFF